MFAGGEELWVFVNGIMVIGISHDPSVPSIPCKSVTLRSGKNKDYFKNSLKKIKNFLCVYVFLISFSKVYFTQVIYYS